MKNRMRPGAGISLAFAAPVLILAVVVSFLGLSDFDLGSAKVREIGFETPTASLSGSLIMPPVDVGAPIALLVHGDGAQDRYSGQGYLPLINALLASGIGVYSWDKPGVGDSSGNWLQQSMDARAEESLAALAAVRQATQSSGNRVGFIGFSQAGWVLPKVALQLDTDTFFVFVGTATNWMQQGAYFTRKRLEAEGRDTAYIEEYVRHHQDMDLALFAPGSSYEFYLANTTDSDPLDKDRFNFVAQNHLADSTAELRLVSQPALVVLGAADLNVDALYEAPIYQEALAGRHHANEVIVWPEATHGLLRARWFNYQLVSQWPWYIQLGALGAGRNIYAPGVIEHISDWILNSAPG